MDNKGQEKLQTLTDIIGKHWSVRDLESNKMKENNAGILVLDDFFQKIIKNNTNFNLDILKSSLKAPNNPISYSYIHQLLMNPMMSVARYKSLLAQEIHQYFMESSQATNSFTNAGSLEHPMHSTNLKNFLSFKVITSSIILKDFITGWRPDYFNELHKNPNYLVEEATKNPDDFKSFLKIVDSSFEQFLIQLRTTIDRSHIYIVPRNNHMTSDLGAYYLDFPLLNVPEQKLVKTIPTYKENNDFLRKIIYCPISETHSAVVVPYSMTFKTTFPAEYKHLIEAFLHSNLPEYIMLTNSKILVIPLPELQAFMHKTMDMIITEPFDLMLMSRALSTLARRNVDAIMETLQDNGQLN